MSSEQQMPKSLRAVVDEQLALYRGRRTIQNRNSIPPTTDIPIRDPQHWYKIPDVICVFVDMKGSTQLSANLHDRSSAGVYQLFTGTAVRIFHEVDAPYIDVRGDGVFALFNSNQVYLAIAAAISFKTFAHTVFVPEIKAKTDLDIGAHIGIDQKTVLVRKVGLARHDDRSDRQNEVWAGKPVNMASKLAAMGDANQLLVSERYFRKVTHELVRKSCGCPDGIKKDLWTAVDVAADPKFDFDTAYRLESIWCSEHGTEYYNKVMQLDR